jgi:hypothetical protein
MCSDAPNVNVSNQLGGMAAAATTDNPLAVMMLKKGLDAHAQSAAALLQLLPQKDGAGTNLDIQM